MDGFVSIDDAVKAESQARIKRIEGLTNLSAFTMLAAAAWLGFPAIQDALAGDSLIMGMGYSLIVIGWAIFVQDLGLMDSKSRTRIGAAATVAWLPLAVLAAASLESGMEKQIGMVIILGVSLAVFRTSRTILVGAMDVIRFRAVMGFLGVVLASSMLFNNDLSQISGMVQAAICASGLLLVILDWFGSDDNRSARKEFDLRLNAMEVRMLQLKSEGAAVDQAGSLVMTAREEGHRDPSWGMRLLDEAEDDIERALSLAFDVDAIREDSLAAVEQAEEIAPTAKRPRKAWDMGQREVDLGSLREGEALFRQAKKRATEIIKWWQQAEEAIREASAMLSKAEHANESLHELLKEARSKLASEKPKKAYEFAMVIPSQISAADDAMDIASDAIKEATRQLKSADGINKEPLKERMVSANNALDNGDHAGAKGLADGVVREINASREAMDDVRRALRQKVHLVSRWSEREDSKDWDARLVEIEDSADSLEWTHAATLLERLTRDLDAEGKASDETAELLEFVQDEWKKLRNQCEASGIKATDEERRSAEEAIALAQDAHKAGRMDEALESLGIADGFMEKLRRRV